MNKWILKLAILGGCAFLHACGGGGGNDNDEANAPPPDTPRPETQQLTITGLVTDNPVANADIQLTVGNKIFSTSADANGHYSLTISFDTSMAADMVRAEATHTENPELRLVSLLGNLELLTDIAGEDDILTSDESTAVNITNLSTAMAGLIEARGNISNQEQLEESRKGLYIPTLISIATSIKLVLDYSSQIDIEMPAEVSDTYALAYNLSAAANFASQIRNEAPDLYKTALEAMLSDTEIVHTEMAESLGSLANTYYISSITGQSQRPDQPPGYSSIDGYRLQFNDNGMGELFGPNHTTDFSWQKTAEGIDLQGATLIEESLTFDESNPSQQILERSVQTLTNIRWLDRGPRSDILLLSGEQYISYPEGEYEDTSPTDYRYVALSVKSTGVIDAADILKIGNKYSLPTLIQSSADNVNHTYSAIEIFLNGSTEDGGTATITVDSVTDEGESSSQDIVGSWAVNTNGRLQIISNPGYEYTFLSNENGQAPLVMVTQSDGNNRRTTVGHALLKEAPTWATGEIEGIYIHPFNYFSPESRFWFEIQMDGKATTYNAEDRNGDGIFSPNEVSKMPTLWKITDAGSLRMRRYNGLDIGGYCEPDEWDPRDDAECVLSDEREWKLYQIRKDDSYWVRQYHRFYDDPWRNMMSGTPEQGHIFSFGVIDNVRYEKVSSHPITLGDD